MFLFHFCVHLSKCHKRTEDLTAYDQDKTFDTEAALLHKLFKNYFPPFSLIQFLTLPPQEKKKRKIENITSQGAVVA